MKPGIRADNAPVNAAPSQLAASRTTAPPRLRAGVTFPLLDGVRAIAALSVVALHCTVQADWFRGWEGAYVRQLAGGVTVFFLLSGFLLYRPFVRARFAGDRIPAVGRYLRRRIVRIVPAYWLALTALAAWPGLPGAPLGLASWRYYLFLQDFHRSTLFDGLGTAWSLGTEMSFYVLLPVYAAVLARGTRRLASRRRVSVELALLAGLSALSLVARTTLSAKHPNLGYTILGTWDWFAIGMALAVVSVACEGAERQPLLVRLVRRRPSLSWLAAFAALTLAAAYWERTHRYDAYAGGALHYIWAVMALFVLLPAVFGVERGAPRRVLANPVVAWLGVVSYGIYLWHLPLVPEVDRALAAVAGRPHHGAVGAVAITVCTSACAIGLAALSYVLVEKPLLALRDRALPSRGRAASAEPHPAVAVPAEAAA